ncbi:potassium transporter [Naematelia encephala]|uniref:Potassium transporter n=1 Tax=Naematelia encephala TaxID=71784 RepID=A0A1Y2BKM8_9TREE|nr:potassium transporter [Naematelia encephala]
MVKMDEENDSKARPESTEVSNVDLEKYERKILRLSGIKLFALAFSTLGVIYSDIGTSPLYVLNGIWSSSGDAPSEEDVIGGISAIIWAITLLPLIKYVGFALEFETGEGEGGPFALFMALFPKHELADDGRSLTTYPTMDSHDPKKKEGLKRFKWPLFIWTVFGTSLTLADGILTPAVSVVSAVEGIAVAKPGVINDIVPISIVFLLLLFAVQGFGIQRLSICFAPITFIWLLLLGSTGIYNIVQFPGIWRAYDPSRAIMYYDNLAGVLLAITGCEAIFAKSVQPTTSWKVTYIS